MANGFDTSKMGLEGVSAGGEESDDVPVEKGMLKQ